MKQPTAPKSTPPTVGDNKPSNKVGDNQPSTLFISLTLDMSWRLALVVLVPILGGFVLDKKLKTVPYLTLAGLILALSGTIIVLKRTLKLAKAKT